MPRVRPYRSPRPTGIPALSEIGLEPLEDFPPFEVEQSQTDRPGRPGRCDGVADRFGRVGGFKFAFGKNGRAEIGARRRRTAGGSVAVWRRERARARPTDQPRKIRRTDARPARGCGRPGGPVPSRSMVRCTTLCPPGDEVRHARPMAGRFRRRRPALALARLGISADPEGCHQKFSVGLGRFRRFRHRPPSERSQAAS